jgi:gliding motility-associated-like protein
MKKVGILLGLFLISNLVRAQLSDLHYLPPLKQERNKIGIDTQAIYLSTPEVTPFEVNAYLGTNTTPVATFQLSNANPYVYPLGNGDNNITFVDNQNTGIILTGSGLRFESQNGEKFYVNFRGAQQSQGSSLTSKGRAALGKRFRWGGGPVIAGDNNNATLGIMATEDNTTVQIFGYDKGMAFRRADNPSAITDDKLTLTLNQGETYVLEYPIRTLQGLNNNLTTKIYDEWMGASVVADKNIAVSLGNALYSPTNDGARDIAIDQIIPETLLGNEYIMVRGYGTDNIEFGIVIATQNATEIYVNNQLAPLATLDAGEYFLVPGLYYSGGSKGENMYIRTSKQAYVYQSTAGASNTANVDYNFLPPVNFLLGNEVDFIPFIDNVGPSKRISGGISIISSAATTDSEIKVFVNEVEQSLAGKRKAVNGTDLWVTYFLDGLAGNVAVISPNSIGLSFTGQSGVIGVSGSFSGFETIPSIDVDVNIVGECLQNGNVTLTAPQGYAIYQWYLEGQPVPGATESRLTPTLSGSYTVGITKSVNGKEYVSAPVDVSNCLPEIKLDVTSSEQKLSVDEETLLRVNYKYQSFFSASDAKVTLSIPDNFQISQSNPSSGTWSNSTRTWNLGTVNPGNEEVLELTLKALTIGNPVTVVASNSQNVFNSENIELTEGNSIPDDSSETFNIREKTIINATTPITKTVLDPDFTLTPSSNNPNPFTFTSSDGGILKISSDGTVEIISAGTANITLKQAASDSYGPGQKIISVTVEKATPSLSEFQDMEKIYGDPDFQVTAPKSTGDGTFTYSSSDPNVATINPTTGQVTIVSAGTTNITATQTATVNYSSSSIQATLTVAKADQIITVGTLPSAETIFQRVGGPEKDPIAITASSSSGEDVLISVPPGSIGTLSGTVGNYTLDDVSGSGTLVIDFEVPESTNYNSASTSVSLDVDKKPQNIDASSMPESIVFSENLNVPLVASAPSTTAMSFAIVSGPATISNGNLLITGTGVITYTINNEGDEVYTKAPELTKELLVTQGTTVLSNFDISDKIYGDPSFAIPVPTSNRNGTFTYSSSDPSVATIVDENIIINKVGTVSITASLASTSNWKGASISTTFKVLKLTPILAGISTLTKRTIDADFTYDVSSTVSLNPIVYRSSDISVATVNSSTGSISIQGIGNTTITASQAATFNHNETSTTLTLTVIKADPTLGEVSDINKVFGDANFMVSAPSSDSGGAFSFSSSNTGVVLIDDITGEVNIVGEGSSTITISQAATANYNPGSTSFTVSVQPLDKTPPNIIAEASITINEGMTEVQTLSADEEVTWSKVTGADAAHFILSETGVLSFNVAPDYENPIDSDTNNTYHVTIRATDANNNLSELLITVTVINVIEDQDSDGVEDPFDICPETPTGDTVDENGCSLSQKDTDNDGVNDATDQCPQTPTGDTVDENGCSLSQKDTDNDGVNDATDQCPQTAEGTTVDENGCSLSQKDTDNDGVNDATDQCPQTAEGTTVDENGCSLSQKDTDNDGVNDATDQCPQTSEGTAVDENGCSLSQKDTDNDGVNDVTDQCPETLSGDTVDENGCSLDQKDMDSDLIPDYQDNCPSIYNPEQVDRDRDGIGDVCDTNEVNISQVITPNGDGINDTWMIYNIENYPNNQVWVYNRWGKVVFSAKNYQNNWNGSYQNNNTILPTASSYLYLLDLEGDGKIDYQGWIFIKE